MKKLFKMSFKDEQRFWASVFIRGDDECWQYTGKMDKNGRPRFNIGGRTIMAHRIAFGIEHGFIPDGNIIRTCKDKGCVNPNHLAERVKID